MSDLSESARRDTFVNGMIDLVDMQVQGIETRDAIRAAFGALPDDKRVEYGNEMLARVMQRSERQNDTSAVDVAREVAPWPWTQPERDRFWQNIEESVRRDERRVEGLSRDGVVLFEVLRSKVEREMRALSPEARSEIVTHILKDIHERERRDGPIELTFGQLSILEPPDLQRARFAQADKAVQGIAKELEGRTRPEIDAIVQRPYVEQVRKRLAEGYPDLGDELELNIREARKMAPSIEETRQHRRMERAEERAR